MMINICLIKLSRLNCWVVTVEILNLTGSHLSSMVADEIIIQEVHKQQL